MTRLPATEFLVRPATDQDLSGIRAVGLATWPATYGFAGDAYVSSGLATWWSMDALTASLRDTDMQVAVDEHDVVVGVGNIDLRRSPPVIWKLYVHPDCHGRGIGTALLDALIVCAGDTPVRLEYVDGNRSAARFYASRGFAVIDREAADQPGWPDVLWAQRPAEDPNARTEPTG
jgi:GNAT superfamily N-acetyltransferase